MTPSPSHARHTCGTKSHPGGPRHRVPSRAACSQIFGWAMQKKSELPRATTQIPCATPTEEARYNDTRSCGRNHPVVSRLWLVHVDHMAFASQVAGTRV